MNDPLREHDILHSRRSFLLNSGMGLGATALASLVPQRSVAANYRIEGKPKAKRVIHLFMNGGPSHVDTFDPKPMLDKLHCKKLPIKNLRTERKTATAFRSPFKFRRWGQSGIEVSELFSNVAESIDDIAVIRSMYADVPNHEPSLLLLNCGDAR